MFAEASSRSTCRATTKGATETSGYRDPADHKPRNSDWVHRFKLDFPALTIVLNGGITSAAQIDEQLQHFDGVIVGRHAYHEPWSMAGWDATFLGADHNPAMAASRSMVDEAWVEHLDVLHRAGRPRMSVMRHATRCGRRWPRHPLVDLPAARAKLN